MNPSYRHFGAGFVLLSLLAVVSCQEEYLPIEAAVELPEAPKEVLCSVKVHHVASCVERVLSVRGAGVHTHSADESLRMHVVSWQLEKLMMHVRTMEQWATGTFTTQQPSRLP